MYFGAPEQPKMKRHPSEEHYILNILQNFSA